MMQRIVKLFTACVFTITLVCFLISSVGAEIAYPNPTKDFFVNDFADLLAAEDQAEMQKKGEALYRATTAQVVVVTVPSLEEQSIEEYSISLARKWGIGDAEKDNGVLLLLALEEREVRVEVGSGLEGAITDVGAWQITQHYGIEHFKKDAFSTGLTAMYDALVNEVYLEYGQEPDDDYVPVAELQEEEEQDSPVFRIIAILVIIGLSLAFSRRRRGGGGHGGHGGLPFFFFTSGGSSGFSGGHGGGFSGGGGFRGGGGGFSGGGSSSKF